MDRDVRPELASRSFSLICILVLVLGLSLVLAAGSAGIRSLRFFLRCRKLFYSLRTGC